MVTLRYHVVTLSAVLLALALGVVLGAGPLARAVDTTVGHQPASSAVSAGAATAALRASAYDDAVSAAVGRHVVRGALAGQRLVLVVAPGAPSAVVAAVSDLARAAGATVAGQVMLTSAWIDPAQSTVLAGITQQLAPPTTKPGTGSPASSAASALAASILTTKPAAVGKTSDPATALLAGLVQGGFVQIKGTPGQAASLAVLIGPASGDGSALLPLADALAAAGTGTVVGAPQGSAQGDGLVAAVRNDAASRAAVSSVDCVDLAAGRIALVLAVAQEQIGRHGQYGMGPGADAPLPRS